jgi:hypothetical protein
MSILVEVRERGNGILTLSTRTQDSSTQQKLSQIEIGVSNFLEV